MGNFAFAAALSLLTAGLLAGPAAADDHDTCWNKAGDEGLAACTRLIAAGKLKGHDLAVAHLQRGADLEDNGDHDGALADYNEAIRLDPTYSFPFNNRGIIRRNKGDNAGALADYEQAIRLDPKNADAYNNRGLLKKDQGDLDGAIADYNQALSLNPKFELAYRNRGVARRAKHDDDGALDDFTHAIQLNPKDDFAYDRRGAARETKNDLDGAIADYTEAIRLNPNYSHAYFDRGHARASKGEVEAAIADYDQAIRLDPKFVLAYNNRGSARGSKGEAEAAIADYDQAIRLDPKFVLAYNNRGLERKSKGDLDGAIADYDQAIRLDPKSALAYINRGVARVAKGEVEAAIPDYEEAIRLDPKFVLAYINRGLARMSKGNLDGAVADFEQALRLDPKNSIAYFQRGVTYSLKSDIDHAFADFTQTIALDPKNARAYIDRADLWSAKGDQDRAIADATTAIRLDPKLAYGYQNRCEYLTIKGELIRALSDCEDALRLFVDPKDKATFCHTGPIIYSCRGQILFDRGRVYELSSAFSKALDDFRAALALDAKDKYKAEAVARMEKKLAAAAAPKPLLTPPAAVSPAAPAVAETRVALVIGNSKYQNAGTLTNPKNDATAVAATLKRIGFTQVTLLLDLPRDKLVNALGTFSQDAARADWALVYYAGHGLELGGVNYLVPVDAKLASDRDASFQAVTLDQAMQAVEGSKKIHIIILDACRDNPFASTMTRSMASTRSISRGLAPVEPDGGTIVAYAAKHGQTAEDGQTGNSPFATALIKNFDTPGLEISLLFRKVRDDVLTATQRRQEPFVYGSLPSDLFYFRAP